MSAAQPTASGWALVLGGGGAPGAAFISGTLQALQARGLSANSAGLVVGTSAGAIAAALIRAGHEPQQLLEVADANAGEASGGRHAAKAWTTRAEMLRRGVGAGGMMARTFLRMPLPLPSAALSQRFPPNLYDVVDRGRLEGLLGSRWPERQTWFVAADVRTLRAVPLGRDPVDLQLSLAEAVLASCAVPGVYPPLRRGEQLLVDGGIVSTTNVKLAVRAGYRNIVCVAPMGFVGRPLPPRQRAMRALPMRQLRREMRWARERGADVLLVTPHVEDLELHGTNVLRSGNNAPVAHRAYERCSELLERPRHRAQLDRCLQLAES